MTLGINYVIPPVAEQAAGWDAKFPNMFTFIQNNLLSQIPTNLTSCATDASKYYTANTPAEIETEVSKMFQAALQQARLTK